MDDLKSIKGIGKATAKRLVEAGITSFAALAAATPEQLVAIDKLGGSPAELTEWIRAAKALVPTILDLQSASPEQVKDQVARIDAARERLAAAQDAVALAEGNPNADQVALAAELDAAQQALDLLIGPGADRAHTVSETNSIHTTPSEAAEDGEAGELAAGLPGGEIGEMGPEEEAAAASERDDFLRHILDEEAIHKAMSALRLHVQAVLEEKGPGGAREFILGERTMIAAVTGQLQRFDSELQRLGLECERTESVWPVGAIRFDGVEQPVGVELKVDVKTAKALLASGAALDRAPNTNTADA